jgi:pilus assembly protein FimV
MVAKSLKWVLALPVIFPPAVLALGLGDIHLNSALNAPLDADIELIGVTPEEMATLKPKVASRDTFTQHGLEWPAFLAGVTLKAVHTADGRDVIKVHSADAITEPFVTLLVEVDWERGRAVHEYTVLLDPPLYTPGQPANANAPVAAPAAGTAAREGTIDRPAPAASTAPTEAPAPAVAKEQPPAETPPATESTPAAPAAPVDSPAAASPVAESGESKPAAPDTYDVRPGDTLSKLANRFANAPEARRWMVATYQANPTAFQHNMNIMRSGAVLRMPDASSIDAISTSDARAEVHRQYAAWRGTAPASTAQAQEPGRLHLVAPTESAADGAGAASPNAAGSNGQVKSLQGRVQELQSELDESRRLLDMRNAELAELQAKLAQKGGAAGAGTAPATAPPVAATPPAQVTPPVASTPQAAPAKAEPALEPKADIQPEAAPAEATPSAAATTEPEAPPAATPKPAPNVVHHAPVAPVASGGGFVDTLKSLWWVLAFGAVAVLGFFSFKAWRSRRQTGFDDSLGRLAAAGAEALSREPSFEASPQLAPSRENSFLVEESGTHVRPRFEGGAAAAPSARHVSTDDTISSETAINLDQGDPLAEADFHMAYGLYDQAADLVRIAIQREPARRDLKLKLLEVFFVWGNKEQFLQMARELAESRDQAAPGEWEKILIMGKQLAPEDPLFAGGAGVSGAAAAGVDLDLEGGQSRVDFDVLGDPIPQEAVGGVDLDIGTAIGERDPNVEAAAARATDRNLALHEDELGQVASTATTRQMTAKLPPGASLSETMAGGTTRQLTTKLPSSRAPTLGGEDSSPEAPTVEQPALGQTSTTTVRQKVETALKQKPAPEHTTEVALDDLGLDLAALDTVDQPNLNAASDAPTLVAGLDERSRRIIENAGQRATNGGPDLKVSETGSWHFDADDLGEATRVDAPEVDTSATSRLAALKQGSNPLDFDIGDATAVSPPTNGAGVDLDVGTATVPDVAFTSTQRLGSEELALPDLDPVTMSEVGTKLDLARAYMDMGDPEGARNILEEVMHEGSVAQKQEAERLIESLPG